MSIASIGSSASSAVYTTKRQADGDTPAVEAAESSATKKAEKQNGGIAPKAASTPTPGGLNKLA